MAESPKGKVSSQDVKRVFLGALLTGLAAGIGFGIDKLPNVPNLGTDVQVLITAALTLVLNLIRKRQEGPAQ